MASTHGMLRGAQHGMARATHTTTFERLSRLGFAAKGVVYLLIGILALRLAFGEGGETTDARGAIAKMAGGEWGQLIVALVGLGLLGYAVWRFAQAFTDEHQGDRKGTLHRAGSFISGLLHTSLALYCWSLLTGDNVGAGGSSRSWTARLLSESWGVLLVALAGVAIIGFGVYQFTKARKGTFMRDMHLTDVAAGQGHWVRRFGQWGYAARGVVFGIIGFFVLQAALNSNANQVRGLDGALDTLAAQPFGTFLLALVAAGLAAYGAFMLVAARYRDVH